MTVFQLPDIPFAPFRLSGTIYSVLLNDHRTVERMGDAALSAPYKAPPRRPVVAVKPLTCLAEDGARVELPVGYDLVQIGPCFGIVIAKTACRVNASEALSYVAGYCFANDMQLLSPDSLPQSHYRPSVRFKARDGYTVLHRTFRSVNELAELAQMIIDVKLDDQKVATLPTFTPVRDITQVIVDLTTFMTLNAGDIVLLGSSDDAPTARYDQTVEVYAPGFGRLSNLLARQAT